MLTRVMWLQNCHTSTNIINNAPLTKYLQNFAKFPCLFISVRQRLVASSSKNWVFSFIAERIMAGAPVSSKCSEQVQQQMQCEQNRMRMCVELAIDRNLWLQMEAGYQNHIVANSTEVKLIFGFFVPTNSLLFCAQLTQCPMYANICILPRAGIPYQHPQFSAIWNHWILNLYPERIFAPNQIMLCRFWLFQSISTLINFLALLWKQPDAAIANQLWWNK